MFFTRDIMQRLSFERKLLVAFMLLLLSGVRLAAQFDVFPGEHRTGDPRVLLSRNVDTTGKISKFGPNRLFFIHAFGQFGAMPFPQVYGAQTNWWSCSVAYGLRMKLKLFYWNALVMDLAYRYDRYSIRQDTPKLLPLSPDHHVRERISIQNFSVTLCDRINFRRRGNVLGTWIDLGVFADNVFRSTNVFVDRHYDSNSPSGRSFKSKTTIAHLPYIEKINYGVTFRCGGEFTSFFVQYRLNPIFNYDSLNNRDLPKIIFGIGFAGWD
jgi:hypothetical protein